MTVLEEQSVTVPLVPPKQGRYGLRGVIRSEWTKMRTVRSTTWTLFATVVLSLGIGALACWAVSSHWDRMSVLDRLTFDPTSQSLTGLLFGQLALGILGILVVSAEYSTGSIRATLSAVPRRPLVVVGKAVVYGVVALVVGEIVSLVAFEIGQAVLSGGPAPHSALGDPGVLRAVVGGGLYLTALGLLAVGLGWIIRHTAGAIATFVGILLILPLILAALPTSFRDAIGKFLPANIGATMTSVRQPQHAFGPWQSFGLLCAYAAVALVVGAWLLVTRDA